MSIFPCPLCDEALEIGTTKKQKPYMICEPCGLQIFVRYQKGIDRLEELSGREVSLMDGFVVCNSCDVAVRKSLHNIQDPLFHEAGLYCPSCEALLLKAPPNWKEQRKG